VLVWRGASAYPARPFVDYPRAVLGGGGTAETDFAQMSIGHAERRHPPCLGAETPAGSCRRSVRVHQPWLSAPRVSLAANLVAWHSTPNSTAPRSHPASPEHAAAHGSEEAAATAQCRPAHFGSLVDLLLRPLNHCADLQPPRPRPHGSAAACSRGTRKSAPSCAHNRDFKVDLIHFRSRSSGLAGS
jgi:hypothetical protein